MSNSIFTYTYEQGQLTVVVTCEVGDFNGDGFDDIKVTLDMEGDGDLRGWFTHLNEAELALLGLTIGDIEVEGVANSEGDDWFTEYQVGDNSVVDLGNGANMNGVNEGPYDLGVEIGTQGESPDQVTEAAFILTADGTHLDPAILFGQDSGLRITSIGPNDRSVKLTEEIPVPPTAENAKVCVFEAGLPNGTDPASNSEFAMGTLMFSDPEGQTVTVVEISFDGNTVMVPQDGTDAILENSLFKFTVDKDGNYVLELKTNEDHPLVDKTGLDDILTLLEQISYTVQDTDGLTASANITIEIKDDGPAADIQRGDGMVLHDESPGKQDDDQDPPLPAGFAAIGIALGWAKSAAAVVDTSGTVFGADGEKAGGGIDLELVITNAVSGLKTTDGTNITLFMLGDLVVGRLNDGGDLPDPAGAIAFAISIDDAGFLSTAQYLSLQHNLNGLDPDDTVALAAGTLAVKLTATDGDMDTSTAMVDVSDAVKYDDDAPTIDNLLLGAMAEVDETVPSGDEGADPFGIGVPLGIDMAQVIQAPVYDVGEDDEGAPGLDLSLSLKVAEGADSGLDTTDGTNITLHTNGDRIEGRVGGTVIFALSISAAGMLTLVNYDTIKHMNILDPDDVLALGLGKVEVIASVTDGDNDKAEKSVDIGNYVKFRDDGPTLGPIADSTNALVFDDATMETKVFSFDTGEDEEGAAGMQLVGYTDADDAGDLAASGLGELEALLGVDITSVKSGNTVTYFTPDGDDAGTEPDELFKLTLTDGDWKFEILQDAPLVTFDLDISALEPGSPTEDEILLGVTGGGLDVKFDGLFWGKGANPANLLDPAANLGVGDPDDDINTNQQGFGIKNDQASQVNNLEGFFAEFGAPAQSGDEDNVFGFFFDIEGIGNISEVTINWAAFDDGVVDASASWQVFNEAGTTLLAEGVGGTANFSLPSGNTEVQFVVKSDDGFDKVYIQTITPDGAASNDPKDWNDGVRFNEFGTIEKAPVPDLTMSFDAQGVDGDGDTTQVESFDVFISDDGMMVA